MARHTDADQRADTAFLVGCAFGRADERDRIAAVQADLADARGSLDMAIGSARDRLARAESAEAALATARRDADELRARLGAVEAVDVKALLAEHYTWQAVGQPGDGWACRCGEHLASWWPEGGVRLRESALDVALRGHVASILRAALASPSAAQGEAEVGARVLAKGHVNTRITPGSQTVAMDDIMPPDSLATDADGSATDG